MVLSIGMIVKNEEKYLEKCLTALQPILNELDSELIIADTGSTDRTVEIAKKFTDNVFDFEWINDFAAARNSTLDRAQGEWYMFLDADEIVQDCTSIIKFFRSGEYMQYMSADYIIRSYTDEGNMDSYVDSHNLRLSKNYPGIRFIRPLHEQLVAFSPTKALDAIFDHYGYLYQNNGKKTELATEKTDRNLDYLFKMLETMSDEEIEANDFFLYDQIADCYEVRDEPDKALEYIDEGLRKLDHKNMSIMGYYTHKISIICYREDYDDIIALADEYFDRSINPWNTQDFASNCMIYARRAYAYYKKKQYNDAINDYIKFIDIYGKYKSGRLNNGEDRRHSIWKLGAGWVQISFDIFFRCCYQEKKFGIANEYAKAIPLKEYESNINFLVNHLNIRMEIMENVGYKGLDYLYNQLGEFGRSYLLLCVRRRIFKTDEKNRTVIIKKLQGLDEKCAALAEIYIEYFNNGSADMEKISAFLEKFRSEDSEDLLYIMLDKQQDITPFLTAEDFFADRAVQLLLDNFAGSARLLAEYDPENISGEGLVKAVSLYGWVLLRTMERNIVISGFFGKYGRIGEIWSEKFGSENVPGDIRAALLVNNVVAARKSNSSGYAEAKQKLSAVVKDLVPILNAYESENPAVVKTNDINSEFEQLAVQVKQNIRELILSGDFASSKSLLQEYKELCPVDPDIYELQKEINELLQ